MEKFRGGNSVDVAEESVVRDFVIKNGGHTVITKILIANNGIAAVKEIRSVRYWAYSMFGNERAIKFIAMASSEDLQANAEYIRMADQYVEVPGGSNNNNYANVELIVDVAERTGAHAVWAGWGHASENPRLPELLMQSKQKIVFIGPPASAMRSLGDKISSTIVAQSVDVPTMAWSGDGVNEVVVNAEGCVEVADDVYLKATTNDVEQGLQHARRIGFPVMIKASEGGGGKGIRMVQKEEDFALAFQNCLLEVPGSPIFIMKLAGESRHLEVQLLADQYGNAISLFGRDCSVQRRHQKIIEEAPVTIASKDVFRQMEKAAVRLAKLVGYVSAGTVEYLYMPKIDKFCFLELNPRLQVEHPTTEMVSEVNLPAAQLQVAMGIPLERNQDIRRLYGAGLESNTPIDFDSGSDAKDEKISKREFEPEPKGHVIAVRITAENPEAGFKPSSGMLETLNFKSSKNVWGYFSVSPSSGLHEFADSQFGHIFAYGANREGARQAMVVALKEMSILGEFRTTTEYLITLLEEKDFVQNSVTTAWLDQLIANKHTSSRPNPAIATLCGAACKAYFTSQQLLDESKKALEKGRMVEKHLLINKFNVGFIYEGVRYEFTVYQTGPASFLLEINGCKNMVALRNLTDGGILVSLGGDTHPCYTREVVGATRLVVDEYTVLLEEESDPTKLITPSPGKLVRYMVESGSEVNAGQPYAEIEVMKMIMPLVAVEKGVVHFLKPAGSSIHAGEVLGVLTLDDPSKVKLAKPFSGEFPQFGLPQIIGDKANQRLEYVTMQIDSIMKGYAKTKPISELLSELTELLADKEVPFLNMNDLLSSLHSRIPAELHAELKKHLETAKMRKAVFPSRSILRTIDLRLRKTPVGELQALSAVIKPVSDLAELYSEGLRSYERHVFLGFLNYYYAVESIFSGAENEQAEIEKIRTMNNENPEKLIEDLRARAGLGVSSTLVIGILEVIKPMSQTSGLFDFEYESALKMLAGIKSRESGKVALKSRELLIRYQIPSQEERERQMEQILKASVTEHVYGLGVEYHQPSYETIKNLIDSNYYVNDVLQKFFYHRISWVRLAALETYVRRAYHVYSIADLNYVTEVGSPFALCWTFYLPDGAMQLSAVPVAPSQIDTPTSIDQTPLPRALSVSDFSMANYGTGEDGDGYRYGVMSSFDSYDDMVEYFEQLLDHLPLEEQGYYSSRPSSPGDSIIGISIVARPHGSKDSALPALTEIDTSKQTLNQNKNQQQQQQPKGVNGLHSKRNKNRYQNVLYIGINVSDEESKSTNEWADSIEQFIQGYSKELRSHGVRRVTFILLVDENHPATFTFREATDYEEDTTIRHIEPALAYQLELSRLGNFEIEPCLTETRQLHIYRATCKTNPEDTRFFVRVLVRPGSRLKATVQTVDFLISETDRLLNDILDSLEILMSQYPNTDCNHLFINFLPIFNLDSSEFEPAYRGFLDRHGGRLFRLRVSEAEIRFLVQIGSSEELPTPIRFCVSNSWGFVPVLESYVEVRKPNTNEWVYSSIDSPPGHLDKKPVSLPYLPRDKLQPRRYKAHIMGTTYVYDFPGLFKHATLAQWKYVQKYNRNARAPVNMFKSKELVWNADRTALVATNNRSPGMNTCGMVAWLFEICTPECPDGRRMVVIANDITFITGSFGVEEDELFYAATVYARSLGIPRIYLSANSGARIGLANEIRELFKPVWVDESAPEKGFRFLYISDADKKFIDTTNSDNKLKTPTIITEPYIHTDGTQCHRLCAIIGAADSLGVENLKGSGLIAGETSRAYRDIFTITLVTCRSVGIGAYLVRLGHRTIQNEGQPIILTGNQALNKVLGRQVYSSNLQLGGTQIMYRNGVSHLTAKDDFAGILKIMRWLSYVPAYVGAPIQPLTLLTWDPVERPVEYCPPKGPSDPRFFLAGTDTNGIHMNGFFDTHSFVEVMGGWAKTVVTGRARLGGIPVGAIAVETRTVENITPADPSNPESHEQLTVEAGGVWYPNSAYKTAQAINDFNNGEGLPLFIFANWRGFSGGQRDMYDQILKFGSYIVDALTQYKQPVFVYVIPNGELRGGAWVVLDSSINPDVMEMYADTKARGGVIEPEGVVEIKYRRPAIIATMDRLDQTLRDLKSRLNSPNLSSSESASINQQINDRIKLLYPVYSQMAVEFADLHDRAGRMKAKGVIRRELDWPSSRSFFYHRLVRRLNEDRLCAGLSQADPSLSRSAAIAALQSWFVQDTYDSVSLESGSSSIIASADFISNWESNDRIVTTWMTNSADSINSRIASIATLTKLNNLTADAELDPSFARQAILKLSSFLDDDTKSKLSSLL